MVGYIKDCALTALGGEGSMVSVGHCRSEGWLLNGTCQGPFVGIPEEAKRRIAAGIDFGSCSLQRVYRRRPVLSPWGSPECEKTRADNARNL